MYQYHSIMIVLTLTLKHYLVEEVVYSTLYTTTRLLLLLQYQFVRLLATIQLLSSYYLATIQLLCYYHTIILVVLQTIMKYQLRPISNIQILSTSNLTTTSMLSKLKLLHTSTQYIVHIVPILYLYQALLYYYSTTACIFLPSCIKTPSFLKKCIFV